MKNRSPDHPRPSQASPADAELFAALTGRLSSDTLRYIPAVILPAGLSIVSASIFTRIFTPGEYGLYALVIAATAMVSAVLAGWMHQSVLRYLPRYKAAGRGAEFVKKLLGVLVGAALPVGLLLLLLIIPFADRLGAYRPFLVPAGLLIVTDVFFLNLVSVFQADLNSKAFSLFKVLDSVLRLALALVFVLLIKRDVVGLIVGAVAAHVLLVVPVMKRIGAFENLREYRHVFDFSFLKIFAAYGLPMVGWLLCGRILEISDRFILGALRDSAEVGVYSANYGLVAMGFGLVSGPILTALYPLVMTAWEKGLKEKAPEIISQFTRFYLLAIVPLVAFICVFSRDIVAIVLGNGFREGYTIIPFVVGGTSVWGLAMIGHKGLEIHEKTRTMFLLVVVAAAVNIVLNFVLIPEYGYNGAAYATFAAYLVYPVLAWRATRDLIPWRIPWFSVARIAVAAAVMIGLMSAVDGLLADDVPWLIRLAASFIAGISAYLGALFVTRELRPRDLRRARR